MPLEASGPNLPPWLNRGRRDWNPDDIMFDSNTFGFLRMRRGCGRTCSGCLRAARQSKYHQGKRTHSNRGAAHVHGSTVEPGSCQAKAEVGLRLRQGFGPAFAKAPAQDFGEAVVL